MTKCISCCISVDYLVEPLARTHRVAVLTLPSSNTSPTVTLSSPTTILLGSSTALTKKMRDPETTPPRLSKPTSDSPHCDTAFLDQVFWEVRLTSGPHWWRVRLFHVGSVSDVLKTTLRVENSAVVTSLMESYGMILLMNKSALWVRKGLGNILSLSRWSYYTVLRPVFRNRATDMTPTLIATDIHSRKRQNNKTLKWMHVNTCTALLMQSEYQSWLDFLL